MTPPTLPFGTAMALAERNLRGPLQRILADEALDPGAWFTLNALGLRGPTPRYFLRAMLGTNGYDERGADELISVLAAWGLVEGDDDALRLTDAGAERYAAVSGRIGEVTRRIFTLFDATQVESARALMQQIAETDPGTIERVAFAEA